MLPLQPLFRTFYRLHCTICTIILTVNNQQLRSLFYNLCRSHLHTQYHNQLGRLPFFHNMQIFLLFLLLCTPWNQLYSPLWYLPCILFLCAVINEKKICSSCTLKTQPAIFPPLIRVSYQYIYYFTYIKMGICFATVNFCLKSRSNRADTCIKRKKWKKQ